MINDNELMISNKSYINKDFATIYPELLDYVNILTNKWNPQTSNESDPGVVLLKLMGFIGDKLNYNSDKNILEDFALSATQESSMRKILSPLGYDMKYYHSATTKVQFTFIGDELNDSNGINKNIKFPALDTIITSDDESIQFVLVNSLELDAKNIPNSALAIQGRKETLTIGDKDVILLENIDSNNRVYFPIQRVAENGVFIHRVDDDSRWECISNLNLSPIHSDVFAFGYDSARGLPYVEFPDDIANLIGNGLHIDYIITDGRDGNVKAKFLTKLIKPTEILINGTDETISFSEDNSNLLIIKNLSASIDGADPETIDEAYNNFKKTIGTFDTLVTCRDYANAIYSMLDLDTDLNVVSNAQVSDRRDDFMYSTRVVSYDTYGQKVTNVKNNINKDITANDLFLYPLSPVSSYTIEGYTGSFKPLNNVAYVERRLENSKTASHDFYHPVESAIRFYGLKNYLKLSAQIATTYKVNNYERKDIISNVISALIKKFNAREVDYGYEIPYNEIQDTILNADSRITFVNLPDPTITTKVLFSNGDEKALISSDGLDYLLTLMAHNILLGKISLFDYDEDFSYDFGQEQISGKAMKLKELSTISTKTEIELDSGLEEELLDNEVIQMLAPSLITSNNYSYGIYYHFTSINSVLENTNYKLGSGEELWITYTDSATKKVITKKFTEGEIIQPKGFTLVPSQEGRGVQRTITFEGQEVTLWFASLGASEEIAIRKINKTTFGKPTNFYWIRNNSDNHLFTSGDAIIKDDVVKGYETILGDGEYLFYTDEGFNNLVSLGSGTTIYTNKLDLVNITAKVVTFEEVMEEGLLGLKDKWNKISLTKESVPLGGTYLLVQENTILTLTQGDKITWTKEESSLSNTITLNNTLQPISGTIEYQIKGEQPDLLEGYNLGEDSKWRIKSRYDINCGRSFAQSIGDERQTVVFTNKDNSTISLGGVGGVGQTFNLNEAYQFAGAESIDVSSKDVVTGNTFYPFSVYCYEYQQVDGSSLVLDRNSEGYVAIKVKSGGDLNADKFCMPNIDEYSVLMVYATITSSNIKIRTFNYVEDTLIVDATTFASELSDKGTLYKFDLTQEEYVSVTTYENDVTYYYVEGSNKKIRLYNSGTSWSDASSTIEITKDGIYNLEIEKGTTEIYIYSDYTTTGSDEDDGYSKNTLILDYIKYINGIDYDSEIGKRYGLNPQIGLENITGNDKSGKTITQLEEALLTKIRDLDNHKESGSLLVLDPQFYYTCRIHNSNVIESKDLTTPQSLYDINNFANKFVISQIDFEKISDDIDILRSSRL